MVVGSVFNNNRTQAVRLPVESRFPDNTKKVTIRIVGSDRIISPINKTWDSFFISKESVSDDFMRERAAQEQTPREPF